VDIRIYYEDTDCGGVVYYANYLKYFERARTAHLEERGFSVKQLMDEGTVFVVVQAELTYRSPARYGDTLTIGTSVTDLGSASLTFSHVVKDKQNGRIVVEGSARLAATDGGGKVRRLDKTMADALRPAARKER